MLFNFHKTKWHHSTRPTNRFNKKIYKKQTAGFGTE